MRYVVAAINMNGYADIPFPTAFNSGIATYSMIAGPGVSSFEFVNANGEGETVPSRGNPILATSAYRIDKV